MRDNDGNLAGSTGDFFSIKLSSATVLERLNSTPRPCSMPGRATWRVGTSRSSDTLTIARLGRAGRTIAFPATGFLADARKYLACGVAGRTAAGGRPQAGLEVVEKLLTTSILAANRTALHAVKRSGNRRAMALELWAEAQVERLIAPLGDRWAHVQAVARQSGSCGGGLSAEDGDVLVAAAFLHDVGYAPSLNRLGFHPVDGAHPWPGAAGLPRRHHSGARFEAEERGLVDKLAAVRRREADGLVVREFDELAPTGRWGSPACRAVGRRGATQPATARPPPTPSTRAGCQSGGRRR